MPNISSLPAPSPDASHGTLSPLTPHKRHLSAKEKLLSLSRRQMRTLESWYQDNPKPSRFSKVVLIESFGGDKSQVGAIHLWFVVRRRIERKERSRAPILLAPMPHRRGLSPVPPHYPLSRSPSLFRPRCRRDTGGTSFSDAMDVALQFQQFSLAPRRPSLVKMDSDCSPLDDHRMLDVELYDAATTTNIRRKSVNKVKEWMDGSHSGGSPNMPTENERNNHLWPPGHTVSKSTASSYDEGYHSRSSMDMRTMDLDHHSRSPSGLFPEASLSPSKSDRSEYLLTPPDHQMTIGVFEWNMESSFTMESPNPVMIPAPCPEVTCCIFPPNDSVPQTAVPDVVVFGAEPNPMLEDQPRRLSDDSQVPQSNGETEDFEDGALSLWTEEIQKTVNLPEYIEPSRLEWFRNRFHLAYSQRSHFYPTTDNCSAPQDDGEGQAAAHDQGDEGMTPTSSGEKGRGTLKRRRKSEEDEENNNNRSRRMRPGQNAGVCEGGDEEAGRLLACPFCKWKPLTYRSCQGMILREIARVKQHLLRVHQVPIHCPLCSREFPGELQRDEHVRQRTCELRPLRTWEGVTADQKAAIRRRVDPTKSKREQWNGIYAILFPGQPLPENPYVERLLSTELQTLQDFFSQEWPPTFQRLISRLPDEVRAQETIIQALSTFIFETGVAEILERFSAARDGSVSPDSGYSSRAVPEQRERPMQEVPPVTEPPSIWVMPPTNDNGDNYTLDANPNPNAGNYTLHPTPPGMHTPGMPTGASFNEAYFLSDDLLLDWPSAWAHPSPGQGAGGPGGPAGNGHGHGHLGTPGQASGL